MRISDWSSDVCSSDLLVDHAAQLGEDAVAEACAVARDEQVARPREQQPQPAGARGGVEEQPADLARAVEVVAQPQDLCVKGALQLFAMLAVGADAIAIEGDRKSTRLNYSH